MTHMPILLAKTLLEERRQEWEALRWQRIAREGRAEQRRIAKVAKARARDEKRSLRRGSAEIDVIIDLTDRAATSEPKEYARS